MQIALRFLTQRNPKSYSVIQAFVCNCSLNCMISFQYRSELRLVMITVIRNGSRQSYICYIYMNIFMYIYMN